jgi:DNA ligase-3
MSETKFSSDYSKRLSKCQKCKQEIPKGDARIAKLTANFFHDGEGEMKSYFHFACLFDTFKRARATTKVIESADEIDGFAQLNANDKSMLIGLIADLDQHRNKGAKPSKKQHDSKPRTSSQKHITKDSDEDDEDDEDHVKMTKPKQVRGVENEDNANSSSDMKLETFIKLCDRIAAQSGNAKTQVIREFLDKGTDKTGFKGNLALFIKFLLPGSSNRVYNLNSVSLVKLYSRLFDQDQDDMLKHLNNGDVANTIKVFFDKSRRLKPKMTSDLTLTEVDHYLNELTKHRAESDQLTVLKDIAANCTSDDLHMIVRLIKKDLRINAGDKIVLEGVSKNAYAAYKVTRDLDDVIERLLKSPLKKDLSIKINLMKPIQPMLADACKSCENALAKCPSGAYVEIKYDGERLQVHKNGSEFNYFSRNLKQVPLHKVEHLKQYIPKAFPFANELILDGEVLLYDMKTKKPLPFGTLGVHKVLLKYFLGHVRSGFSHIDIQKQLRIISGFIVIIELLGFQTEAENKQLQTGFLFEWN